MSELLSPPHVSHPPHAGQPDADVTRPETARPPVKPAMDRLEQGRPEMERPKEHGAYAMLGLPLVTAFVLAGFSWVGLWTAIASIAGFLSHEAVMITSGRRGPRVLRETPAAKRHAVILVSIATGFGLLAFTLAEPAVRLALAGSLVLASVGFGLSAGGWHRTQMAQLVSCVGLVAPSLVVLLAGGMPSAPAFAISAAWALGQAALLVAVRSVIASHKAASQGRAPRQNDLLQASFSAAVVSGIFLGFSGFICVVPMIAGAIFLRLYRPSVKRLRAVGWCLVATSLLSAAAMIVRQS